MWLWWRPQGAPEWLAAQRAFVESMAAYSIVSYLLQVAIHVTCHLNSLTPMPFAVETYSITWVPFITECCTVDSKCERGSLVFERDALVLDALVFPVVDPSS